MLKKIKGSCGARYSVRVCTNVIKVSRDVIGALNPLFSVNAHALLN